jgi:hypothetical protein
MSKLFATETVDPFNFDRLYGREKYSLNRMEMRSVNFPAEVDPDHATAVWSDRIITAWYDAAQLIDSVYNGDAFFAGATQESFMKFAKAVALAINFKYEVTGARVARYTNAASQYPVYLLEVTNGGKGLRDTTRQSRMRCYRDGFTDGYYFASESDETDGTMD